MHERLKVLDVRSPVAFTYLTMFYKDGTEMERRFDGGNSETKISMLLLGTFPQITQSVPALCLSPALLDGKCCFSRVLLRVPQRVTKSCFDFGIFRWLTKLNVDPSTALLAIVRDYKVG